MDTFSLADTYLLKGAKLGDIKAVQIISETREFKGGETIVSMEDDGNDIMIITSGRAQVQTREGDLVDELRKGDMIGEIAFIDNLPRTANVISSGDSRVLVIPAKRLRELMKQNPELEVTLYKNVAKALCARLRDANLQVESLLLPR